VKDVTSLIENIQKPWNEFKDFLNEYEEALGTDCKKSKLGKAPKTIKNTLNDLMGKVEKLRKEIVELLQAINSLLSLLMYTLLSCMGPSRPVARIHYP
jgi:hypothetical protein